MKMSSRQGGTRSNQPISVAGQRSYFNRFTIDGVENTDVNFNTPNILPSIDALQEFKVQTDREDHGRTRQQARTAIWSEAVFLKFGEYSDPSSRA